MVKTREEIRTDFEEVFRKTATGVVLNTSENDIEVMRMISDTFNSALKEYIKELLKQFPEAARERKASVLTIAYVSYERGIFTLDLLAEELVKILMTE